MLNKIILLATVTALAALLTPAELSAWGAARVGYARVGPGGVHAGSRTVVSGPGGVYAGGRSAGVGYGGAYRSGYAGGVGYGGAYRAGYAGGVGYGGAYRAGYGYIR